MTQMIQELRPEEYPEFCALWKKAFGDGPEVVDELFQALGDSVTAYVMGFDQLAAELTQFDMGSVIMADGSELPALISYAICTDPDYRGKGFGSSITTFAKDRANGDHKASILCPAEPGLVWFYQPLGYHALFPVRETIMRRSAIDALRKDLFQAAEGLEARKQNGVVLEILTPGKYGDVRESYLQGTVHFRLSPEILKYIGGGWTRFCRIRVNGIEMGICTVHVEKRAEEAPGLPAAGPEQVMVIEELLVKSEMADHFTAEMLGAAVADWGRCRICQMRSPVENAPAAEASGSERSPEKSGVLDARVQTVFTAIHHDVETQAMIAFPDEKTKKAFLKSAEKSPLKPYFGFPLD